MTSRSLCFKLIKEDVKRRIWMLCLFTLGFFFMFPVASAFQAGVIQEVRIPEWGIYLYTIAMKDWFSYQNGGMAALMVIGAVIAGMSSFSYLNSKSKVDFYHGIPVRRELLYISNNISGFLMFAVPYALMMAAGIAVAVGNGVEPSALLGTALRAYGFNVLYFLLLYITAVIAAMLTGNLIIGILGTGVLYFYVPMAVAIVRAYFTEFFTNCTPWHINEMSEPWLRLSPFYEYAYRLVQLSKGTLTAPGIALDIAVAAALLVVGCILYRKRPSEAAGRAMAFPFSCPVFRIPIVLLSSATGGLFFWSMRDTTGWAVFGLICGSVISHCVIEIIYHFDFKKMFSHWKQLALCMAAAGAFLMIFRFDWFGFDTYLPDENAEVTADVMLEDLNNGISYGELTQDDEGNYLWEIEWDYNHMFGRSQNLPSAAVRSLAKKALEYQEETEQNHTYLPEAAESADDSDSTIISKMQQVLDSDQSDIYTGVTVRYNLPGGRQVYRTYNSVPLSLVEEELEEIYAEEAFKKANYPVLEMDASDVAEMRYREYRGANDMIADNLTDGEFAELLTAYQQDLAELTIEQMQREMPVGEIRFVSSEMKKALRWRTEQDEAAKNGDSGSYRMYSEDYRMRRFKNEDYYPVYRSFKRVCGLLEKQGIRPGEETVLAPTQRIQVTYYGGARDFVCDISDAEEIQELMKLLQPNSSAYTPFFCPERVEITVAAVKDDKEYVYSAAVKKGSLPEFVKERLKEDE